MPGSAPKAWRQHEGTHRLLKIIDMGIYLTRTALIVLADRFVAFTMCRLVTGNERHVMCSTCHWQYKAPVICDSGSHSSIALIIASIYRRTKCRNLLLNIANLASLVYVFLSLLCVSRKPMGRCIVADAEGYNLLGRSHEFRK